MPGYNNWIGYDRELKTCSFDMSSMNTGLNKEQTIEYNIQKITEKYDNLYVGLSGGIDSEFAAKCLLDRGIKFTPVIVDYYSNASEVWWAHKWCYDNKIEPDIIYFDITNFLNQCSKYSIELNTSFISGIDSILEKYISDRNGHMIGPCGEPFAREFCLDDKFQTVSSTVLDFSTYDFTLESHIPDKHPYGFLTFTPEMLYNCVLELDYSKPIQIALAEYYGVIPRPKIPMIVNISMFGSDFINIVRDINAGNDLYSIEIGQRDFFLKKCIEKSIINCSFKRK